MKLTAEQARDVADDAAKGRPYLRDYASILAEILHYIEKAALLSNKSQVFSYGIYKDRPVVNELKALGYTVRSLDDGERIEVSWGGR